MIVAQEVVLGLISRYISTNCTLLGAHDILRSQHTTKEGGGGGSPTFAVLAAQRNGSKIPTNVAWAFSVSLHIR